MKRKRSNTESKLQSQIITLTNQHLGLDNGTNGTIKKVLNNYIPNNDINLTGNCIFNNHLVHRSTSKRPDSPQKKSKSFLTLSRQYNNNDNTTRTNERQGHPSSEFSRDRGREDEEFEYHATTFENDITDSRDRNQTDNPTTTTKKTGHEIIIKKFSPYFQRKEGDQYKKTNTTKNIDRNETETTNEKECESSDDNKEQQTEEDEYSDSSKEEEENNAKAKNGYKYQNQKETDDAEKENITTEFSYVPSGVKLNQSIISVPPILKRNKDKGYIPREDGRLRNDTEQAFNQGWKDEIITREILLEGDKNYNFVTLVAGHLNVSRIIQMYQADGLEAIWKNREDFRRQQMLLSRKEQSELASLLSESKSLLDAIEVLQRDIDSINQLQAFMNTKLRKYKSKYDKYTDRIEDVELESQIGNIYALLYNILIETQYENSLNTRLLSLTNISNLIDEAHSRVINSDTFMEKITELLYSTDDIYVSEFADNIHEYWGKKGQYQYRFDDVTWGIVFIHAIVIILYYYSSLIANSPDTYKEWISNLYNSSALNWPFNLYGTVTIDIIEEYQTSRYYKIFSTTIANIYNPKSDDLIKYIRNGVTKLNDTRKRYFLNRNEIESFIRRDLDNLFLTYTDLRDFDDVNVSVAYKNLEDTLDTRLKALSANLLSSEQKLKLVRDNIENKTTLKTPVLPYANRREWAMSPEMSGKIKLKPIVMAGISNAYKKITQYCPKLRGVDVEMLQFSDPSKNEFAKLVACEIGVIRAQYPDQWIPDRKRLDTRMDLINALQGFINMDYNSSGVYLNSSFSYF